MYTWRKKSIMPKKVQKLPMTELNLFKAFIVKQHVWT